MTISTALDLDRAGRNDEAVEAIRHHQSGLLDRGGSLDEIVEAFRAEARIQRHRGDAVSLARACDAAGQAVLLSRLPAASREVAIPARLELAACLIGRGDPAGAETIAGFRDHPDAGIAGWAWRLLGEAALLAERPFEAVAALLNAVAENQRGKDHHHEAGTRVLLLLAFSRAGHLEDADRLALRHGTPADAPTGLPGIRFLLARAEHEHRAGRIGEALRSLEVAETRLGGTSGLGVLRRQLLTLRAGCLADWCQPDEADRLRTKAGTLPLPAHLDIAATTPRTARDRDARDATRWLGDQPRPGTAPGTDPQAVAALLRDLATLPRREAEHAAVVSRLLDSLAGRPGLERDEALLLLEAGSLLAESGPGHREAAERLLRRALARLKFLEGTEQWLAQARVTLGQLLPDSEREQALDLLVRGIQGLDEQRFQMLDRSYRDGWLTRREHPAVARAIELASETDAALAADLIIFSRVAGVLVPRDGQQVPLVPVPRLRYIDGTESRLGSTGSCNFL